MSIIEMEKILEEAIEYWSDKNKQKTDFLKCLLEISKTNSINGHKHVYAIVESFGVDEYKNEFAELKFYIK